jgi:hypothetical protein
LRSGRPDGAGWAGWAFRAVLASWSFGTVAHQRKLLSNLTGDSIEPLGNLPANGVEFLDHHRTQFGDESVPLAFHKGAFAGPFVALIGEYLTENFVPRLS